MTFHIRAPRFVDPGDYGLIADDAGHPLSERYGTLAEAQQHYPFATALNQQIDYCAVQHASNLAFGCEGQEHGTNSHLNSRLHLPAGAYQFGNDTWTVRNLASGVIEGDGRLATVIRGNKTILAFDGIWYSKCQDLSFQTQATDATACMEIDGNVPGHPYATRGVQGVTLQDVLLDAGMSTYCLTLNRQGSSAAQGSECAFINVHLQSASEAVYYQRGFNALNNQFFGGNLQNYSKHGMWVVGGTISVYGTGFQSTRGFAQYENDGWDILIGEVGAYESCSIYGCRTESMRFIRNAGAVFTDVRACAGNLALPGWSANTTYGPGTTQGKAIHAGGRLFVATTPGTSGSTLPLFPPLNDTTPVEDGTVVWTQLMFDSINIVNGAMDTETVKTQVGQIKGPDINRSRRTAIDGYRITTEDTLLVDCTDGPKTIYMPQPLTHQGRIITVKKVDTSLNDLTIKHQGLGFGDAGAKLIPGGSRGSRTFVDGDGEAGGVRRWQTIAEFNPT